jgi:regulator of protease activity HflC (stomatin/prohibitin superfamily)
LNIATIFGVIATIAWIVAIFVIVLIIFQAARSKPVKKGATIVLVVIIAAILLTTVSAGLVFINPEERGVVISAISPNGYRDKALEPGLRWIVPFAESVIRYPISKQTYTMSIAPEEGNIKGDDSIEARTADGQKVLIDASVIFAIDPQKVVQVHITWQNRYSTDLVRAVSRGVIRDAVSQFGIEEVYSSKRLELVQDIREALQEKMAENGLLLSDFVLRNISFSDEYAASVEQKQIAEQQAQQAKFVVEQRKQEADQAREVAKGQRDAAIFRAEGDAQARVIQAQAEADALKLIAEALKNNPDLLTYQYITKISPNVQVMFLPSNAPFIFPLPDMQTVEIPSTTTISP